MAAIVSTTGTAYYGLRKQKEVFVAFSHSTSE